MSSDKFDFIILEIPDDITSDMIKDLNQIALNIKLEDALILDQILRLDSADISEDDLSEDDLFEIGEESLRTKKAVQNFLVDSISKIIVPRMYSKNRISSSLGDSDFSYITIRGRSYVISGQQNSYYSDKLNKSYMYIMALSASNILDSFLRQDKGS